MTTHYAQHLLWCTLLSCCFLSGQAQESPVQIYGEVFFYGNIISEELNTCVQQNPVSDPSPAALDIVETIYADIAHAYEYAYKTGTGGNQGEVSWYIRRDVDPRYGEKLVVQISGPDGWLCHLVYDYLQHYANQGCIRWNLLDQVTYDQPQPAPVYDQPLPKGYNNYDPPLITSGNPPPPGEYYQPASRLTTTATEVAYGRAPRILDVNLRTHPSSSYTLPAQPFRKVSNAGKIATLLTDALYRQGYTQIALHNNDSSSFDIITALEEVDAKGLRIRTVADHLYKRSFISLNNYRQLLKNEPPGYYRFFVFSFEPKEKNPIEYTAPRSPPPVTEYHTIFYSLSDDQPPRPSNEKAPPPPQGSDITIKVYEFERPLYQKETIFRQEEKALLDAYTHLQRSKLGASLNEVFGN